MKLKLPSKNVDLNRFFKKIGLSNIYFEGLNYNKSFQKDKRLSKIPYGPDLLDLYYIYEIIRLNNRLTILEYGCGWSTIIINSALQFLKYKNNSKFFYRCYEPYKLHVLDNSKKFISISKKRLNKYFKDTNNVKFHYSEVVMDTFNGRYCTKYTNHPLTNPDFIYVDGPDQFDVKGKINNFTVNSKNMMPMISDILRYEHFLTPGTIILFDGRQSNVRFFKSNIQRNWSNKFIKKTGQHVFYLNESHLGEINKNQLKFYNS